MASVEGGLVVVETDFLGPGTRAPITRANAAFRAASFALCYQGRWMTDLTHGSGNVLGLWLLEDVRLLSVV